MGGLQRPHNIKVDGGFGGVSSNNGNGFGRVRDEAENKCYGCGQTSHYIRNCPMIYAVGNTNQQAIGNINSPRGGGRGNVSGFGRGRPANYGGYFGGSFSAYPRRGGSGRGSWIRRRRDGRFLPGKISCIQEDGTELVWVEDGVSGSEHDDGRIDSGVDATQFAEYDEGGGVDDNINNINLVDYYEDNFYDHYNEGTSHVTM